MDQFANKYKNFKNINMSSKERQLLEEATEGAKNYLITEAIDDIDLEKTEAFLDYCTQSLYAVMWADWIENNSDKKVTGDILELAPLYTDKMPSDEAAQLENRAASMIEAFESANDNEDILFLYRYAIELDQQQPSSVDDNSTLEVFGLLVIMRMLGHGISWEDDHVDPNFDYPDVEVSYSEYPESFPDKRLEEPEFQEPKRKPEKKLDPWENDPDWWKN